MLIWLTIIAGVAAVALLALGLRGRRTDDHPLCRRCGYDLTGRDAAAAGVCPECGVDLSRPRALRTGHRQRRPRPLVFGVGLLTILLLAGGFAGWDAAHQQDWRRRLLRHAPLGYLIRQASSADPADRFLTLNELWERSLQNRLSGPDWDRIAAAGLAYQGDLAKPWDFGWGYLIETAHAAGRRSDEQWRRYAKQAWPAVFRLDVRPAVRRGDPLPVMLWQRAGRVGPKSALRLETRHLTLAWAGQPPIPTNETDFGGAGQMQGNGGSLFGQGCHGLPGSFPAGLADGPQHVHVTAAVRVGTVDGQGAFHPIDAGTVDLPATFTLVPADHPTVRMVRDPSLVDLLHRSIQTRWMHGSDLELDVAGPPVGLSFDVFLRQPGRPDLPVGTLARAAAPAGNTMMTGVARWPALPRGSTVDVVFRSNPGVAADTVDVSQAWDGELVYRGLVVP